MLASGFTAFFPRKQNEFPDMWMKHIVTSSHHIFNLLEEKSYCMMFVFKESLRTRTRRRGIKVGRWQEKPGPRIQCLVYEIQQGLVFRELTTS